MVHADDVIPLLAEQIRRDGRVDAAAHGCDDSGLVRRESGHAWVLLGSRASIMAA